MERSAVHMCWVPQVPIPGPGNTSTESTSVRLCLFFLSFPTGIRFSYFLESRNRSEGNILLHSEPLTCGAFTRTWLPLVMESDGFTIT